MAPLVLGLYYPLLTFLNMGLPVTANTDNCTVSNTTLIRKFGKLDAYYDLDTKDLETLFRNAVNVSFLIIDTSKGCTRPSMTSRRQHRLPIGNF